MHLRVLALDYDGVLNRYDRYERGAIAACGYLDRTLMAKVSRLCVKTRASILVTSMWRLNARDHIRPAQYLADELQGYGLDGRVPVLGGTPFLPCAPRGLEILEWTKTQPRRFRLAILDDRKDLDPYTKHLVRTDSFVGVTDEQIEAARKLLTKGALIEPWAWSDGCTQCAS